MTERLRACFGPRRDAPARLLRVQRMCPELLQNSAEVVRPDQQLDFHVLYKQNCSGCHGDNGRGGAAIPLNNPAYLAVAGAQISAPLRRKVYPVRSCRPSPKAPVAC